MQAHYRRDALPLRRCEAPEALRANDPFRQLGVAAGVHAIRDIVEQAGGLQQGTVPLGNPEEVVRLVEEPQGQVRDMPPVRLRVFAIEDALMGWAQTDPQAALNWASTMNGIPSRSVVVAVSDLAEQNPQAAIAFATGITNPKDRLGYFNAIATAWGQNDPAAALQWVEGFPSTSTHDAAVASILADLSHTDPKSAIGALDRIEDPTARDNATKDIGLNWGQQDMPGALAWLQSNVASGTATAASISASRTLFGNWANADPNAAASYLETIPTGNLHTTLATALASSWASSDAPAAMEWARSLPPDGGQEAAVGSVVTANARQDPQGSWQFAMTSMTGPLQQQTLDSVIRTWAAADAASAAPVLMSAIETNPQLSSAIGTVAQQWVRQDEHAASQWIAQLPPGPGRDAGAVQLVSVAMHTDPATAFNWAASISNAPQRVAQITRTVNLWATTDPNAATDAVQSANLSAAQRNNLLNTIQRLSK